ncbi:ABC transporter substrate-binding protein [Peptoniphilus sp. HMSC075B08]|uniref:ABC transporter substrate-binding protein n=1 Tax=Peptoniphilus sp. HMSC075B08 TaxID=1739525 RepID=UPI0008A38B65|nr:ABC transporter substrate-binding protein [Peptoniphilus sp. HMSC075B08]OFO61567.1 ABC transporter substrate-binding protein [Peptoniphilus sp. HMSC075B08]
MKKKIIIGMLLVLSLFMTACSSKDKGDEEGKILKVAVSEDTTSLETSSIDDDYAENILIQVYDTLVKRNAKGEIVNSLAESIENPDPQTFKIKLREGVKFSNGDPLTVDDVIFTLNRAAETDKFKPFYGKIDKNSYQKEDDLTFSFKLTEPDAAFLSSLSHPAVSILSKAYVEGGADLATEPMGTGPFVLDEWIQNDHATFSVNENYWGEKPQIAGIEMKVIPEASQRIIELESGGVDLAYKVDPSEIPNIEENDELKLYRKLDNSVHFIGFNMEKAPFDKKEAREAMVNAIDMNTIFETVYMNSGKLATSPINPNFKYSIADSLETNKVNKDKAKELFAAAGMGEGTNLSIYTSDNTQRVNVATMMQAQLKEYGIGLNVERLEWGAFVDALKRQEHNMFIMSWNPSIVDAHYELFQPFHSSNKGQGPNYMYFGNEELDNLMKEGLSTVDEAKRAEIYKRAQELINQEYPWLYICYGETLVAANNRVEGLQLLPKYPQELKDVTLLEK